jgi:hypothetical protein
MNISMTFAPIHDFLPRKFPIQNSEDSDLLPAFVVDKQTGGNPWLGNMFDNNDSLPNIESPRIQIQPFRQQSQIIQTPTTLPPVNF